MLDIGRDQQPRETARPALPDPDRLAVRAVRRVLYMVAAWPLPIALLVLVVASWRLGGPLRWIALTVLVGGAAALVATRAGRDRAVRAYTAQLAHARRVNSYRDAAALGATLGVRDRHGNSRRVRVRHDPDGGIVSLDVDIRGVGAAAIERQCDVWVSTLGLVPGSSLAVRPGVNRGRVMVEVVAPIPPLTVRVTGLPLLDPGGGLVLGLREDGRLLVWEPAASPHVLLSGATGSGKTQTITRLLEAAEAAGYQLWIADYYKATFADWAGRRGVRHVVDKAGIAQMCAEARAEMNARYLHCRADQHMQFTPLLLVLEEAADLLDPDSGRTDAAKADQALVAGIRDSIMAIGRLGRQVRVHLVVAPQRGDAALLGGPLRDQLTYRVVMLRHARDATLAMAVDLTRDCLVPGREPPVRVRDLPAPPGRVLVEVDGGLVVAQVAA